METTYFVLGMLSVFALILIGVITWGWLTIDTERQNIHSEFREHNDRLERQITDIWRGMDNKMTDSVRESNSYTDKRIDKLIDTYFDIKKNKDLLKG